MHFIFAQARTLSILFCYTIFQFKWHKKNDHQCIFSARRQKLLFGTIHLNSRGKYDWKTRKGIHKLSNHTFFTSPLANIKDGKKLGKGGIWNFYCKLYSDFFSSTLRPSLQKNIILDFFRKTFSLRSKFYLLMREFFMCVQSKFWSILLGTSYIFSQIYYHLSCPPSFWKYCWLPTTGLRYVRPLNYIY